MTSFFRRLFELEIEIPPLERPDLALAQRFYTKAGHLVAIDRDTSPDQRGVTAIFGTVLRDGEHQLERGEFEQRIQPLHERLLGLQQAIWLSSMDPPNPDFLALFQNGPGPAIAHYLHCSGLVVRNNEGSRFQPTLVGPRAELTFDYLLAPDLDSEYFNTHGLIAVAKE